MAQENNPPPTTSTDDSTVNVFNPQGELVSIPKEQLSDALFNRFTVATPEDEKAYDQKQNASGIGQGILAGAEGYASTFSAGTSSLLENKLSDMGVPGISPEERNARQEENPWWRGAGEAAGIFTDGPVGLLSKGVAGLFEMGASKVLGKVVGEGFVNKVGSTAVKYAIENSLFQSGQEIDKYFAGKSDPSAPIETAALNVGLSGAIGGIAGGVVSGILAPIVKATGLETYLKTLTSRLNAGADGVPPPLPDEVLNPPMPELPPPLPTEITTQGKSQFIDPEGTMEKAGEETRAQLLKNGATDSSISNAIGLSGMRDVPNELQTGMGQDPMRRYDFQVLRESPSKAGIYLKKSLSDFYEKAGNNIIEALGKTPQEAQSLSELSENKVGSNIRSNLVNDLKEKFQPISDAYDNWFNRAAKVDISPRIAAQLSDNLGLLNISSGSSKLPGTAQADLMDWAMKVVSSQENLEDLSKFRSAVMGKVRNNPAELKFIGGELNSILKDAESNIISHGVQSGMVKGSLEEFRNINSQYGPIRSLLDDLDSRLNVGNYKGVKTFIDRLNEMTPEKFLNKIATNNDADFINKILPHFPEVMEGVRDYHLNDLIKEAVVKAKRSEEFNLTNLFKNIGGMSPEMKQFVLPPESMNRINATRYLMDAIPEKLNNSGTAVTLMSLMKKGMPATAIGLTSILTGAGAAASFGVTTLAHMFSKEAPDAVKLGLLKFLGSSGPIDAPGFKSMVESINATIKGENLMGKAVKGLFETGKYIIPQEIIESKTKREKLDKLLLAYQDNPHKFLDLGHNGSSYMPEQNMAIGALAARSVYYLNSLRPKTVKQGPLDPDSKPNPIQLADFNRALDLVEQPLSIFNHIKNGTITNNDINTYNTVFPNLSNRLRDKITSEMVDHVSNGGKILYKTSLGISKFLGQPLVASLNPQSLMQIQSTFAPVSSAESQQGGRMQQRAHPKAFKNMAQLEGTKSQNKIMSRWD